MPFLRKNDEEKTARFFSSRLLFNLFLFPFSFTQLNSTQLAPQLPPLHTHRFPRPPPPTTMIYLRAVVVLFAFALASGHAQARELKRKEFSPRFFLSFFAFDKRSFFFSSFSSHLPPLSSLHPPRPKQSSTPRPCSLTRRPSSLASRSRCATVFVISFPSTKK